jgi:hypothetical protein
MQKLVIKTNPHSQAQCQVAQANAQPKPAIELVCLPTLSLPSLKKLNLLSQRKRNDRIEKKSQTIERQERPVGNTVYKKLGR